MKLNKKALVMINVILVIALITSMALLVNKTGRINALENKLDDYKNEISQIDDYKNKVTILSNLNKYYKEKSKEINDEYNELKRKLNLDGLNGEEIDKVGKISEDTPLDIETSAIVVKTAKKYELKPSLILSVMELESNFKQYEVGEAQDRGYMQIIPSTERWLAKEFYDKHHLEYNPDRIFEPEYNIELAATYLSILKDAYGNNYNRILSEYNRGPYNLARYYQENQTYETAYSRVILNKEQKYLSYNE